MAFFRPFFKNTSGAAAVETVLILPVVIVLMFGSFELGSYFWNEHKVVKSVRDGARYAGRQPFSSYTCGSVNAAVENQIKNVVRTGQVANGGIAKIAGWDNTGVTVTVSCASAALDGSDDTFVDTGIYRGFGEAPIVTVSATVAYPSLFRALGFNSDALTLRASSQSAVMGI